MPYPFVQVHLGAVLAFHARVLDHVGFAYQDRGWLPAYCQLVDSQIRRFAAVHSGPTLSSHMPTVAQPSIDPLLRSRSLWKKCGTVVLWRH